MSNKTKKIMLIIAIAITFLPDLWITLSVMFDVPDSFEFIDGIIQTLYFSRWAIRIICIIFLIKISKDGSQVPTSKVIADGLEEKKVLDQKQNKKPILLILSFVPIILLIIYSFAHSNSCFITTCYEGFDAVIFNFVAIGFLVSPILAICLIYQIYKIALIISNKKKK